MPQFTAAFGVAIVSAQVQWLFVTKFCAHIGSQPHSSHHPEWVPDPPSNHSRRPSGNHKKIYSVTKFKLTRTNKKKHTGQKTLLFYSRRCNLISLIASGDVCKEGSATNVIRFAHCYCSFYLFSQLVFRNHAVILWWVGAGRVWGNCKRLMDYANFCLLLKLD